MQKLIAILNVIAWAGFWAFGYIALTSDTESSSLTIAALLAAIGGGIGIVAWLWLVRQSEATGYARPAKQVPREHHRQPEGQA